MITGLCGFADLLRRHGADIGSAELIDAARALTMTDLAERTAVHRTLTLTIAWAGTSPTAFDELFDVWFSGADLVLDNGMVDADEPDMPAVALDADTVDATRIHADDAIALETRDEPSEADVEGATGDGSSSPASPAPVAPTEGDGVPVAASGTLAPAAPGDDSTDDNPHGPPSVVELPDAPVAAELELAREALSAAVERRRLREAAISVPHRVTAVAQPLSSDERSTLVRVVRDFERHLDGAPSWRRRAQARGSIDLRRTIRRTVTTGGHPIDLRHTGRRQDAARLVVLVDLSMSVRGTARLVLHLVHRMRSMLGSIRVFGFVDGCVPLDRALRMADPGTAIEHVLGLVDVDASSDPGRAFRQWWSRSHHLVTASTHVVVLGDGRCNGLDPAFDVIELMSRRSASSLWISPEPTGAWTLGRGEMAHYATLVDHAVAVRTIDDLGQLTRLPRRGALRRAHQR
ncbi:MAG: VWA domain-containing protein [Actinomycetota bacterium]